MRILLDWRAVPRVQIPLPPPETRYKTHKRKMGVFLIYKEKAPKYGANSNELLIIVLKM